MDREKLRRLYEATGWEANGHVISDKMLRVKGEPLVQIECVEACRVLGIYQWQRSNYDETKEQAEEAAQALCDLLNYVEELCYGTRL